MDRADYSAIGESITGRFRMKAFLEMSEDRRRLVCQQAAERLLFPYGESPSFDEILQRVQEFESTFNQEMKTS